MAQSFEDYLNSIGAKQTSIGYGKVPWAYGDDPKGHIQYWQVPNQPGRGLTSATPYSLYSQQDVNRGYVPQKEYSYGEQTQGGFGAKPGYVDPSGGFLGYGATASELTNPDLLRGYSDFLAQDPAREAQQIANR